ncbi:hypothetical protein J14TS5_33900 [Paenibacillus lautus]|nr:hypothetical protein J14TS5_33900 [Paenibacillus lautus]
MALLCHKQMTKIDKTRISIHQTVRGTYSVFRDSYGRKYFQIDTYGSEDREIPNKISQSLQFDEETALFLIQLIKKEFKIK